MAFKIECWQSAAGAWKKLSMQILFALTLMQCAKTALGLVRLLPTSVSSALLRWMPSQLSAILAMGISDQA